MLISPTKLTRIGMLLALVWALSGPIQAQTLSPTIFNVSPTTVTAGGPSFVLEVNGANFIPSSVVRWNGADRPTTYLNSRQLQANITAAEIAVAGTATVTVFSPASTAGPGGISNSATVSITNPIPVVMAITPPSAFVNSLPFSLTVNGNGFVPSSVVRWNGAPRPTTFLSATQLTAAISAADLQAVGTASITVVNSAPGGGTSTAITFSILPQPIPPPTLLSVSANALTQGARQTQLTLIGTNFRPGVRVVIGQATTNPSLTQASDIAVESFRRINDTTMVAIVSVSPQASLNIRAIDVVNTDNTDTGLRGSRTTQLLRIAQSSSLGAPLQVLSLAVTHPRPGTVIAQGDQITGEAIITGAGTGTITGQWLWDGNVIEQFAVNLTGGERTPLKTTNGLPTVNLGLHTLELRISQPNLMQTPPINVVINPSNWKLTRLLSPNSGAGFPPNVPPTLRWAIVPGAAKYQVGFATTPYFRAVTQWYDVNDTAWKIPAEIWNRLPEGELYWTVRVVETSGATRVPALLRRLQHLPKGVLEATASELQRSASGSVLLAWQQLKTPALYRVSISRDAEGRSIVRRYLTNQSQADLRAMQNSFTPGETYFWRVEAYSPTGRYIATGAPQTFVPRSDRKLEETSWQIKVPAPPAKFQRLEIASLSIPPIPKSMVVERDTPQQVEIVNRTPPPDQAINDARAPISFEVNGKLNASDLTLLVDDTDVTALVAITDNKISFTPAIPLENGTHQITAEIGAETVTWKFNVSSTGKAAAESDAVTPGTDAEAEIAKAGAPVAPATGSDATGETTGKPFNLDASSNTQWVSGQEADTNVVSVAAQGHYQNGLVRLEMNGSGTINSILGPHPRHIKGLFSDYVLRFSHEKDGLQTDLRFGMIAPDLFTNAEFINTGVPREGVQASLNTRLGKFSFFRNTSDKGFGEGIGFGWHQELIGASYDTPLLKKDPDRVKLRLMWMSARDVGGLPVKNSFDTEGNVIPSLDSQAQPRNGRAFGALLSIKLGQQWMWTSEYAFTYNNPNRLAGDSQTLFGRALRTNLTGIWQKFNVNVSFRDVTPNFSAPANATLSRFSQSDRRGLDVNISRDTKLGNFNATYQYQ